jgi:hypothetical protein
VGRIASSTYCLIICLVDEEYMSIGTKQNHEKRSVASYLEFQALKLYLREVHPEWERADEKERACC